MSDFSLDFQNIIDNRLNDVIDDLKEENLEYASCRAYIKENYNRVKSIIENLPEVDREFMHTYKSHHFNRIALKDCIKLLEWLNVI